IVRDDPGGSPADDLGLRADDGPHAAKEACLVVFRRGEEQRQIAWLGAHHLDRGDGGFATRGLGVWILPGAYPRPRAHMHPSFDQTRIGSNSRLMVLAGVAPSPQSQASRGWPGRERSVARCPVAAIIEVSRGSGDLPGYGG